MKPALRFVVGSTWHPSQGQGISSASKDLAVGLRRLGLDVFYCCPDGPETDWFDDHGIVPLIHDSSGSERKIARMLLRQVRSVQADCVINNDNHVLQSVFPILDGVRFSVCHAMRWGTFALAIRSAKHSDAVIAISNDMLNKLRCKGVDPLRLIHIANGIPRKESVDNIILKPDSINKIRVVFGGPWTRLKGAPDVFKVLDRFSGDDRISFSLFGDGKLLSKLMRLLKKNKNAAYFGRVDRQTFIDELRGSDVLLFPSKLEGCPVTVLEAMSFGVVPFVRHATGGMTDIVEHGLSGFVFSGANWHASAIDCLLSLIENPGSLSALKRNAISRVEREYSAERVARQYLSAFHLREAGRLGVTANEKIFVYRAHRAEKPGKGFLSKRRALAYRLGMLSGVWVPREELESD